uniref:C2H2-type domain-containing protein n=1 Tax=Panagrellus redivivus TaxID=6233 RepID=A0A7E4VHP2_PANRE
MAHPDFYYEPQQPFVDNMSYNDEFFGFPNEPYPTPLDHKYSPEADFTVNNVDYMPMAEGGVNDYTNYYFVDENGSAAENNSNDGYMDMMQPAGDYFVYTDGSFNEVQQPQQMYFESAPMGQQDVKPGPVEPYYDAGVLNHTDLSVNTGQLYKKQVDEYIPIAVHQPPPPITHEIIEAPPVLEFHGFAPPSNIAPSEVEELAVVQKKVLEKYVDKFKKTVDNNSFRSRAKYYDILSVDDLYTRLEKLKCCDPADRRCTYHTCGRRFINLEVLAFHVGYAHQAVNNSSTCMVCGMTCRNSKGKLTHMLTAHKDLAKKHQHICMVQAPKFLLANSSSNPDVITLQD